MPNLAVNVAVIHEGKILLTQREDFETWVLPSGGVEEGESLAQAAIREVKEETGLDVELTRLVGVYSRLGNLSPGYVVMFAARAVGGERSVQPGETIAVEWFAFADIPTPLSVGHYRRIQDAVSGSGGAVVTQKTQSPLLAGKITKKELYELRDRSGLSRQEFYIQMLDDAEYKEIVEVESV